MRNRLTFAVLMTCLIVLQPAGLSTLNAQGPKEGITVHGHWIIDIREADGTLVKHVEFENGLVDGGRMLLGILRGKMTVGLWSIEMEGPGGISPCSQTPTSQGNCLITEGYQPPYNQVWGVSTNLFTNEAFISATADPGLLLEGSVKAVHAGSISQVETGLLYCNNELAPAACSPALSSFGNVFTRKALAEPIGVAAGQIIQAKVIITFTSGSAAVVTPL